MALCTEHGLHLDRLFAVRHLRSRRDPKGDGSIGMVDDTVLQGTKSDLFVRDKIEWMLLDTGAEILLDRIREMVIV